MIVIVQRGKCIEWVRDYPTVYQAIIGANEWVCKLGGNGSYFKYFDLPDGARWDNGDLRVTLMKESEYV